MQSTTNWILFIRWYLSLEIKLINIPATNHSQSLRKNIHLSFIISTSVLLHMFIDNKIIFTLQYFRMQGYFLPCYGEGNGNPLLPGKFRGLRSLVGYSPWGHNESDTTE